MGFTGQQFEHLFGPVGEEVGKLPAARSGHLTWRTQLMTRRHLDAIEVRHVATPEGPEPGQFLWRDRLYVVREVLGRWVEAGAWWSGSAVRLVLTGEGPGAPAGRVDDGERELWRVEAGAGRSAGTGVFDLVHERATGRWSLVRVAD